MLEYNVSTISCRLHDERVDLCTWRISPMMSYEGADHMYDRDFKVRSPQGREVRIRISRRSSGTAPKLMEVVYEVESVNYSGPLSLLALLGDANNEDWFPLCSDIGEYSARLSVQAIPSFYKMDLSFHYSLHKNGELVNDRPIRIEKQRIVGFAHTIEAQTGDVFSMKMQVYVG